MAANQLVKISSPTTARKRCCTRSQHSCSERLMGWRSCGSADRMEPAGEDMTREGSCARAGVCDIAVSGQGEADVGMPADDGHGLTQRLQSRLQEPGGASRRQPAVPARGL